MNTRNRYAPSLILGLTLTLVAQSARAATSLCVEVRADDANRESLRRLVLDEVAHHPTHAVVESGCVSTLQVELFELTGTWYLTARINQEVPLRHGLSKVSELESALKDTISTVLGHDPVYLSEDITHYSAMQRMGRSIFKQGQNIYRFEFFQGIGFSGENAAFAPGAAVAFTRGSDNWQIFARVYFAGWPNEPGSSGRALRVLTGGDGGLTYEFSALGQTSLYVSLGLGVTFMRYEGRVDPADAGSVTALNQPGAAAYLRAGVRFFRYNDFDLDLYAASHIPMFKTEDIDSQLKGYYTPTVEIGLGVGF